MAVVVQNKYGWLICHQKFLQNTYTNCLDNQINCKSFRFRQEYFEINTPLLMTSAATKQAEKSKMTIVLKKKSQKKKAVDSSLYHSEVRTIIGEAAEALCKEARNMEYLKYPAVVAEEWFDNNSAARQASKEVNCHCGLCDLCQNNSYSLESEDVYFQYSGGEPIIICANQKYFLIPPNSSYYHADIKDIHILIDTKYDVVIIDPPWKNKSVRRKKGYMTLTNEELLKLPIQSFTKPGSLIILWATNNENQLVFAKEKLFRAWKVQHCADWHWVKITKKGMFVYEMDSNQKKPYENLIIGRVSFGENEMESANPIIEPHKVIVSIPSSIHSHKPPLSDILKLYIPEGAKCLELFARSLLPGWTSYGNEVLKLQNADLFERIDI